MSQQLFVVGWMAEKYPTLIREISERGYETGSHTHFHQLVTNRMKLHFIKT